MKLLSHGPEPCASANSAIPANATLKFYSAELSGAEPFSLIRNKIFNGKCHKIHKPIKQCEVYHKTVILSMENTKIIY